MICNEFLLECQIRIFSVFLFAFCIVSQRYTVKATYVEFLIFVGVNEIRWTYIYI